MFGIQLSAQAAANCSTGYKTQTNPFSRWAGCDIAQNGNGITTSSSNGEWSAGFDFGDFIAIKGNAYCLQEQYPMPSQKVCDENTFHISENVDTTKTGSTCWCKVTAWQPFTVSRDAPFQEIDANYIQMPVDNNEPCTLQACGYICASVGDTSAALIGLYYKTAGLRATIYKSVKQCSPDDQLTCDEIGYTLQDNECKPIMYTITYKDKDGNTITEFENSVATTYTIESETITLPTPSAPEGMEFVGWYYNAEFSGDAVEQIATGSTEDKVLYAKFTETETPIVVPGSECEPGYYLPQDSDTCAICEENNYCVGGANPIMQPCPTGLVSPTGTISSDNCGKKMLVGKDVLYLTQKQQTTPALAVKIDGKVYYAKTTPLSQIEQPAGHFLRTRIDGVEYSIHDNTVQRRK